MIAVIGIMLIILFVLSLYLLAAGFDEDSPQLVAIGAALFVAASLFLVIH